MTKIDWIDADKHENANTFIWGVVLTSIGILLLYGAMYCSLHFTDFQNGSAIRNIMGFCGIVGLLLGAIPLIFGVPFIFVPMYRETKKLYSKKSDNNQRVKTSRLNMRMSFRNGYSRNDNGNNNGNGDDSK